MKKRAQIPDEYTYGILLSGLARNSQFPNAVKRALSLYASMEAPDSNIPPSILHSNAVLKVCSQARDLDSMWELAGRLPQSGPLAPDKVTWTTLLTAIKDNAEQRGLEKIPAKLREKAVLDGRRLWEDVAFHLKKGETEIDEQLVCTMGRLLLLGNHPKDWDDVFTLVEQTTGIPRQAPRLGTSRNPGSHIPTLKEETTSRSQDIKGQLFGDVFDTVETVRGMTRVGRGGLSIFTKPGNNMLALLIEASLKVRSKHLAFKYWELLTEPQSSYRIAPDIENFHAYLRLLRVNRSSAQAVDLVCKQMPVAGVNPSRTAFNLAMTTCNRDTNNSNSFEHGTVLFKLAASAESSPVPYGVAEHTLDPPFVTSYLNLARRTDRDGNNIEEALRRTRPHVAILLDTLQRSTNQIRTAANARTVELAQSLIGCYDALSALYFENKGKNEATKSSNTAKQYMWHKSRLTTLVARFPGSPSRPGRLP
jgi:hypothetical protein